MFSVLQVCSVEGVKSMRMSTVKKMAMVLLVASYCAVPAADVYKWKDDNGKLHFGDKAPAEKSAQEIEKNLAIKNMDHASKDLPVSRPTAKKKTADEQMLEIKEKKKLQEAIGPVCDQLKRDIASIERGDRAEFYDENGRLENILEKDRGKKLEEWQGHYQEMGCERLERN